MVVYKELAKTWRKNRQREEFLRSRSEIPSFEQTVFELCAIFEAHEEDRISWIEMQARVLRLFRETKCLRPPDVRPF